MFKQHIFFKIRWSLGGPGCDYPTMVVNLIVLGGKKNPSFPCGSFFKTAFFPLSFPCFLSCSRFFLRKHYSLQVYYLFNFLTDFILPLKDVLLPKHIFKTKRLPSSGSIQSARPIGHTLLGLYCGLTSVRETNINGRSSCPQRI